MMMYKMSLNYALEHSMNDGLDQIRSLNAAALQSPDGKRATLGKMNKEKVIFPKL